MAQKAANIIQEAWRAIPEYCVKKSKESLPKTVQAMLNKDDHAEYYI